MGEPRAWRHGRLERFLRRVLGPHIGPLVYTPCVCVCAGDRRPAYRFLVLTTDTVLLVDHPPRSVRRTVDMACIRQIRTVHDVAHFLSASDRRDVQHIYISYSEASSEDATKQERLEIMPPLLTSSPVSSPSLSHVSTQSEDCLETAGSTRLTTGRRPSLLRRFLSQSLRRKSLSRRKPEGEPEEQPKVEPQAQVDRRDSRISTMSVESSWEGFPEMSKRSSLWSLRSVPEVQSAPAKSKREHLHLYLLRGGSSIFSALRSLWTQHLLDLSVRMDPTLGLQKTSAAAKSDIKEILTKVGDRSWPTTELLQYPLSLDMVASAELTNIIYEDPDLFSRILEKLRDLCIKPADGLKRHFTTEAATERIRVSSAIVEILGALLRGRVLAYPLSQEEAKHLISTLITLPWVPRRTRDVVLEVLSATSSSAAWETAPDAPVVRAMSSYLVSCAALLSSLIGLAEQVVSTTSRTTSQSWVIKEMANDSNTETIVSLFVAQAVKLSSNSNLEPSQSVSLYHYLRVVEALMPAPSGGCTNRGLFAEEFRYFITPTAVGAKLQSDLPIKFHLLKLIEVIQKKCQDDSQSS